MVGIPIQPGCKSGGKETRKLHQLRTKSENGFVLDHFCGSNSNLFIDVSSGVIKCGRLGTISINMVDFHLFSIATFDFARVYKMHDQPFVGPCGPWVPFVVAVLIFSMQKAFQSSTAFWFIIQSAVYSSLPIFEGWVSETGSHGPGKVDGTRIRTLQHNLGTTDRFWYRLWTWSSPMVEIMEIWRWKHIKTALQTMFVNVVGYHMEFKSLLNIINRIIELFLGHLHHSSYIPLLSSPFSALNPKKHGWYSARRLGDAECIHRYYLICICTYTCSTSIFCPWL